jgi:uncharacterized membrane protein
MKRGLWLVLVEVVVLTFAFRLDPLYHSIILQVLWAIGCSMLILGLLVRFLPLKVIGVIGALIFFGHDILDYIKGPQSGAGFDLYKLFLTSFGTLLPLGKTHFVFDLYAIIPWTGIMMLGYVFGSLYKSGYDPQRRKQILLYTGIFALVVFITFRFMNNYGDPAPWAVQRNGVYTFMSFLNVSKYPPSLLYSCMTLGVSLIILAVTEKVANKLTAFFMIYGNVPFFYYVLHFYIIRLINVIVFFAAGFSTNQIIDPRSRFFFKPNNFGYPLWVVYLVWLVVISSLYLPCKWFSNYKKTHRQWWLSYL